LILCDSGGGSHPASRITRSHTQRWLPPAKGGALAPPKAGHFAPGRRTPRRTPAFSPYGFGGGAAGRRLGAQPAAGPARTTRNAEKARLLTGARLLGGGASSYGRRPPGCRFASPDRTFSATRHTTQRARRWYEPVAMSVLPESRTISLCASPRRTRP